MKNAMVLAKEELDADDRLKLIFEDDAFLPRNTVAAAKKLTTQDQVQALIVFGTNQGLAIVDFVESQRVPFISVNVNRSVVKDKQYAVMLMPALEALTQKNIEEAQKRAYQRVAIIASQQDSCLLQRKIFEQSQKFEITYSDEVPPTDIRFYEHATRIIAGKPDAVFLSVLPPQGSLIAKALREQGYRRELFGGLQMANLAERDAAQGALNSAWVVSGDDRSAAEYYKLATQKFRETPTAESVYTYDSIKLLLEAEKSGDINKYLHTVKDFVGYAGKYSADGANAFDIKVVAKEFTAEGFKYLN